MSRCGARVYSLAPACSAAMLATGSPHVAEIAFQIASRCRPAHARAAEGRCMGTRGNGGTVAIIAETKPHTRKLVAAAPVFEAPTSARNAVRRSNRREQIQSSVPVPASRKPTASALRMMRVRRGTPARAVTLLGRRHEQEAPRQGAAGAVHATAARHDGLTRMAGNIDGR